MNGEKQLTLQEYYNNLGLNNFTISDYFRLAQYKLFEIKDYRQLKKNGRTRLENASLSITSMFNVPVNFTCLNKPCDDV